MLITTAIAREHIETDLSDAAVTRLIEDAEFAIIKRFGPHVTQLDTLEGNAGANAVFLTRRISVVLSATETVEGTETVLAADDYKIVHDGRGLQRLSTGTNPATYWGESVVVSYTPESDSAERIRVCIDLVKLSVGYSAKKEERIGDHAEILFSYEAERNEILSRLRQWTFA